jgi:hypothetical protein
MNTTISRPKSSAAVERGVTLIEKMKLFGDDLGSICGKKPLAVQITAITRDHGDPGDLVVPLPPG